MSKKAEKNTSYISVDAGAFAYANRFKGIKDIRYYLNGVFIEPLVGGGVNIVGTDGHRIVVIHDPNGECKEPVIIYPHATLISQCNAASGDIVNFDSEGFGSVRPKGCPQGMAVQCQIAEGAKFPKYRALFEKLRETSIASEAFPYDMTLLEKLKFPHSWGKFSKLSIGLYGQDKGSSLILHGHANKLKIAAIIRGLVKEFNYDASNIDWLGEPLKVAEAAESEQS